MWRFLQPNTGQSDKWERPHSKLFLSWFFYYLFIFLFLCPKERESFSFVLFFIRFSRIPESVEISLDKSRLLLVLFICISLSANARENGQKEKKRVKGDSHLRGIQYKKNCPVIHVISYKSNCFFFLIRAVTI